MNEDRTRTRDCRGRASRNARRAIKAINDADQVQVIGTLGLAFAY